MHVNRRLAIAAFAAILFTTWTYASAQSGYPTKAIRLIVGFPPGQALDNVARVLAAGLSTELGKTVFVENKPGAAGIIATEFVKYAPADGYTLLLGSGATFAINPALYRKLPYDPVKDYEPIALVSSSPLFLAVSPKLPIHNLKEMIAYVKEHPGKLSYGSGGSGSTQHIAMEMLKREAGLDIMHVPYKGSPAMVQDLIAGSVDFGFDTSTSILPHARSGKVRLIAVSSHSRLLVEPSILTLDEQGLPGFEASPWSGLVAPKGTPISVLERLNIAVNKVLVSREFATAMKNSGGTVGGGGLAQFQAFMKTEIERWGKAVKASGAQVD